MHHQTIMYTSCPVFVKPPLAFTDNFWPQIPSHLSLLVVSLPISSCPPANPYVPKHSCVASFLGKYLLFPLANDLVLTHCKFKAHWCSLHDKTRTLLSSTSSLSSLCLFLLFPCYMKNQIWKTLIIQPKWQDLTRNLRGSEWLVLGN